MMPQELEDRIYSISEVSELTGTQPHLLRQWETRFSQLRPHRSQTGIRQYEKKDIEIIRRIKTLLKHEGMTSRGARKQLSRELSEVGHPKNKQEMLDMLDRIADEARAIIKLFDPEDEEKQQDD